MPSFRRISQVIATAGPKADFGTADGAAAAVALAAAACDKAAAEAAMGLGSGEAEGAGVVGPVRF